MQPTQRASGIAPGELLIEGAFELHRQARNMLKALPVPVLEQEDLAICKYERAWFPGVGVRKSSLQCGRVHLNPSVLTGPLHTQLGLHNNRTVCAV